MLIFLVLLLLVCFVLVAAHQRGSAFAHRLKPAAALSSAVLFYALLLCDTFFTRISPSCRPVRTQNSSVGSVPIVEVHTTSLQKKASAAVRRARIFEESTFTGPLLSRWRLEPPALLEQRDPIVVHAEVVMNVDTQVAAAAGNGGGGNGGGGNSVERVVPAQPTIHQKAVLPEVMERPDGLTDGRSKDGRDAGKVDMKEKFDIQVFLTTDPKKSPKPVTVFRALPWDDLLTAIRSALDVAAIDLVLDSHRAQVTTVEYLMPGDVLEVLPLEIDASGRERAARGASEASAVLKCILPSESDLASPAAVPSRDTFLERAKYIPLRLSLEERKLLRTVKAVLNASTYTDKIDVVFKKKMTRLRAQMHEICSMLTGIIMCLDYKAGQALVEDRDFAKYKKAIQNVIEVRFVVLFLRMQFCFALGDCVVIRTHHNLLSGCPQIARRHKIMNPEKMRSSYGKLLFLLQDALHPQVQESLEFPIAGPMHTVYTFLEVSHVSFRAYSCAHAWH